jgi:hypothetical protein
LGDNVDQSLVNANAGEKSAGKNPTNATKEKEGS